MTSSNSPLQIEPIVRFPLQTRATISSSVVNDNSNWISRLANYFDTSNIEIPMSTSAPKPKRTYRRKQKLETIDLNNNNEFVLQDVITPRRSGNKIEKDGSLTFVAIKNIEKEVDEIFRQRKKRRNVPTVTKESDSDSDEIPLKLIKTHKCPNCKKMYKTPKTLGQHLKKCSASIVSSTTETNNKMSSVSDMVIKDENEGKMFKRICNNINSFLFIDKEDLKLVYCSDSDTNEGKIIGLFILKY